MKPSTKLLAILIVVTILISSMSLAFTQLSQSSVLTNPINGLDPTNGLDDTSTTEDDSAQTNLTGNAFMNQDGDGIYDAGEGVSNVNVELHDANGTLLGTTVTGEDGYYLIGNLSGCDGCEIEYYIIEQNTTVFDISDFNLIANLTNMVDLPLFETSEIEGHAFTDLDGDNTYDQGEGKADTDIEIYDENRNLITSTKTDANGSYSCPDLSPCNCTVYAYPYGLDQSDSAMYKNVTLGPSENETVDFIISASDNINGTAFIDLDGDGVYDEGEGISGAVIGLCDENGTLVNTTVTDGNGSFSFSDVTPGDYTLSGSSYGEGDIINHVTKNITFIGKDDAYVDIIFPSNMTRLEGWACQDSDGDGVYDDGEGVSDIVIWLLDANGSAIGNTYTDESGAFVFMGVDSGTYSIVGPLTSQNVTNIYVEKSQNTSVVMFIPAGMTVNGRVYVDEDLDGWDLGEEVASIVVLIYNETGTVIGRTLTNGTGFFKFPGIAPGYYIVVTLTGYGFSFQTDGTVDLTRDIRIITDLGSISGTVFADADGDGEYDVGECISNAIVVLYDEENIIGSMMTDENGSYSFNGLGDGVYTVDASNGELGSGVVKNGTANVSQASDEILDIDLSEDVELLSTETEITQLPSIIEKDESFFVNGTVTASGETVSNVLVTVIITPFKGSSDETVIGQGTVIDGIFSIQCVVPDDLDLGQYQIIARCEGSSIYLPSDSDPSVQVKDDSSISITSPELVLLNMTYVLVITFTEEVSGKGVGSTLLISVDGSVSNIATDENGSASFQFSFSRIGVHNITVTFEGSTYLYGDVAACNITVPEIEVDISSATLIRGENNTVSLFIHASNLVIGNQTTIISLDGAELISVTTDNDGTSDVVIRPGEDAILASVNLTFQIVNMTSIESAVQIVSRTSIVLWIEGLTLNATLLDDRGNAISDMVISIDPGSNSLLTNETGLASFALDPEETTEYNVSFNGSKTYLASSSSIEMIVIVKDAGAGDNSLLLIMIATVTVVAVVATYYFMRRKGSVAAIDDEKVEKNRSNEIIPDLVAPYVIKLPDISEPFPRVWGIGEKLRVRVDGFSGTLRFSVDGAVIDIQEVSGTYENASILSKGNHRISVSGPLGEASIGIRVVDYREEIVDIYGESFERYRTSMVGLKSSMTPREMQILIKERNDIDRSAVEDVVSLFEIAEFSVHDVGREEYERMFIASMSMGAALT